MPAPTDETTEPAAASPGEAPRVDVAKDEAPLPPALIVSLRAPDRAVARIIGPMTPRQAGLWGATIDFAITPWGCAAEPVAGDEPVAGAEPVAAAEPVGRPTPTNVLSLPHPRLSPLPTRVATATSFAVGGEGSDDA